MAASALLLGTVGCASARPDDPFRSSGRDGEVILVVENHAFSDMRIDLLRSDVFLRVGRVGAQSVGRFPLGHLIGDGDGDLRIRAMAQRSGVEAWTSPRLLVDRGQEVRVTIGNFLSHSSAIVVDR